MKKTTKIVFAALSAFMLAGCGISEGYADKVNKAAKSESEKDDYSYDKCIKDLGDPTIDGYVALVKSGVCIWVSGCKNAEEVSKKQEDGKKLKSLTITFVGGKATAAVYSDNYSDKK
ncbi:MAG: hypothetical protein MJ238_01545 [Bacilli bacterium]|nr:hypothetical protein [Bacilli bacterium]